MRNGVVVAVVVAILAALAGLAYHVHQGNKGMEQAANSAGTTTQKFDSNAAANQGSTPPGNAAAVGGDRSK